jgi:hypothetical protein
MAYSRSLIGNWFEDRMKEESASTPITASNPEKSYFDTTNHLSFENPASIQGEISRVGPRRKNLEAAWRNEAESVARAVSEAPMHIRYKTTMGQAYGREKESLGRIWFDELSKNPDRINYATDQPTTLYTATPTSFTGMTAATGKNPLARNAAFSGTDYWDGPVKDL